MDCEGHGQNTLHHEQRDIISIGMHMGMVGLRWVDEVETGVQDG